MNPQAPLEALDRSLKYLIADGMAQTVINALLNRSRSRYMTLTEPPDRSAMLSDILTRSSNKVRLQIPVRESCWARYSAAACANTFWKR